MTMPETSPIRRSSLHLGHIVEWRPTATLDVLRRRAELLNRVRAFFHDRKVLEVEVPVLQGGANLDPGVEPFIVQTQDGPRFLPTSPEHPLKRLVAAGYGPVWTLAPVFRAHEKGRKHAPEFRMLEWYRPDWDDWKLLREVLALFDALTGWGETHEVIGYRQAFQKYVGIDPATVAVAELEKLLGDQASAARLPNGSIHRTIALDLLLTERIEPHLGRGHWTVMTDYPVHVAAQARLRADEDDRPVAARFEIYRDGVELANGYWELTDGAELAGRLEREMDKRPGSALTRDRRFETAIAEGLPECAGVAVGFDRLVMLALGLNSVSDTQAFAAGNE
jgi:elongation factor P--(R)-beta-lysine ligase